MASDVTIDRGLRTKEFPCGKTSSSGNSSHRVGLRFDDLKLAVLQDDEDKSPVDDNMRETPLRVLWKKNGKFLKAKKIEASLNPYKSPELLGSGH